MRTENGESGQHVGEDVERHAQPLGDRRAVARVGHEQLQHARGLAERGGALDRLRRVDRVDEPDAAVVDQRVRGAQQRVVDDPGDPQRMFG